MNAGAKFGATAGTSINWIIQEPPFCRLCDVKIREAPKMAKYCPVLLAPSGTRSHKKSFRPKGIIYDIGWWWTGFDLICCFAMELFKGWTKKTWCF